MKVVILAGGLGTRLQEETIVKPKPMVEIGGKPILWHIMKIYSFYGFNEFVIALGYKGDIIKNYFMNYDFIESDISIKLKNKEVKYLNTHSENWTVDLIDTGATTQTGGRIKRISQIIGKESFMLTYGDGVANINILKLLEFHNKKNKLVTVTAVKPPSRFGKINIDRDEITGFSEKPVENGDWINGGFFVIEPGAIDFIDGDQTLWEQEPLKNIVEKNQMSAFFHKGFWQCMDTLRDVNYLESVWKSGDAPWKIWN